MVTWSNVAPQKKTRESKRFSGVLMSIFIGVVVNSGCQGLIFGSVFEGNQLGNRRLRRIETKTLRY